MLLTSFVSMISNPLCILAIISISFGIACSLIAKKLTKTIRKTENVSDDDKLLIGIKTTALILIMLGFILFIFWGLEAL